ALTTTPSKESATEAGSKASGSISCTFHTCERRCAGAFTALLYRFHQKCGRTRFARDYHLQLKHMNGRDRIKQPLSPGVSQGATHRLKGQRFEQEGEVVAGVAKGSREAGVQSTST